MGTNCTSLGCGSIASGYNSCMVAGGLFDGITREERRARQWANAAERRFRISKGYSKDTLWQRLSQKLHTA